MAKYRKKPVVIEAMQFNGNDKECLEFCPIARDSEDTKPNLIIPTSEGDMICNVGDYIIKEPFDKERGFYPCKPDIFEQTYEKVEL